MGVSALSLESATQLSTVPGPGTQDHGPGAGQVPGPCPGRCTPSATFGMTNRWRTPVHIRLIILVRLRHTHAGSNVFLPLAARAHETRCTQSGLSSDTERLLFAAPRTLASAITRHAACSLTHDLAGGRMGGARRARRGELGRPPFYSNSSLITAARAAVWAAVARRASRCRHAGHISGDTWAVGARAGRV